MHKTAVNTGPKLSVDVTDDEKKIAKQLQEEFKEVLSGLDVAVKTVSDLRNVVVEQRPSKQDLKNKYKGRLLRYKNKIRKIFNAFLTNVKNGFETMNQVMDPNMMRLREILVAEIDELGDGVESLLDLLNDLNVEDFTKSLERLVGQIEKRQESIIDVVDNQLFGHIGENILGKMKISDIQTRIRKRSRIINQLVR